MAGLSSLVRTPSVKFFTEPANLVLIAIALISGGMLLWPVITRRDRGLSAADATQLINRRNAVVIDVRSAEEFGKGHLPQARHLQFDELKSKVGQVAKNKNTPVLLVCQTGAHSAKAQSVLKEAGYAEVFTLQGGVNAWQQAGMPVVRQGAVK
jgi:rhodanese-related sulfurtransferase